MGIGLIISTLDCYSAFGLPTTFEVEKGKLLFNNGCYLIGRLECLLRNIIFAMKRPWLDQQCSVLTKIFYHFKKLLCTNSKYFKLSTKGSKVVLGYINHSSFQVVDSNQSTWLYLTRVN